MASGRRVVRTFRGAALLEAHVDGARSTKPHAQAGPEARDARGR